MVLSSCVERCKLLELAYVEDGLLAGGAEECRDMVALSKRNFGDMADGLWLIFAPIPRTVDPKAVMRSEEFTTRRLDLGKMSNLNM